ncbi:MAG: hypothetical protein WC520_00980 [Candidatus Paceibacterota bacterium]
MAIEITSGEGSSSVIEKIISVIAIGAIIIVIGVFLYLRFWAIPKGEEKINSIATEISDLRNQGAGINAVSIGTEIRDYKVLLASRATASLFFESFEKWVHPQIYFDNISLDIPSRTVILTGKSKGFQPLIQQLAYFDSQKILIEQSSVSNVKSSLGVVSFDLNLVVKPETLKQISQ